MPLIHARVFHVGIFFIFFIFGWFGEKMAWDRVRRVERLGHHSRFQFLGSIWISQREALERWRRFRSVAVWVGLRDFSMRVFFCRVFVFSVGCC